MRTLTETPLDDLQYIPPSLEGATTRPSSRKSVLKGIIVFVLFVASAYYIWWQKSAEEKFMARTVENQSSSAVTAEKEMDRAVGLETSSKPTRTLEVSTQPPTTTPLPTPIPKRVDKKAPATLTTTSEKIASPSNTQRLQISPADVKSTEAKPSNTQAESQKSRNVTTPARVPSQPLTSVEPKPLTSISRQPGIQQLAQQFIPVQTEPRLVRLEKIQFPLDLLRNGIEGEVIVRVRISAEGKPLEGKVLKSSNRVLDDPVLQAAMNSDYSPGMMTSGPVTTWATIPFKFRR